MAKYDISLEGAANLRQLASDLTKLCDENTECGRRLKTTVVGLGDGLGTYENQILELVDVVNNALEPGKESIENLVSEINRIASEVESLVTF